MNATESEHGSCNILLVEDNRARRRLARKSLRGAGVRLPIACRHKWRRGVGVSQARRAFRQCARPAIILLDLNLPGLDGREVLEAVKTSEALRRIPVIVLTSSRSNVDIRECYDLHANAFMTKAANFDDLLELVRQIGTYWLTAVRLPTD